MESKQRAINGTSEGGTNLRRRKGHPESMASEMGGRLFGGWAETRGIIEL